MTSDSSQASYRRARRDLAAALEDLQGRAAELAHARYVRTSRGSLIAEARRTRALSIDVVTMAVLAERAAGATWTEVAQALSLEEQFVVEHYEPLERQWATGNGIGPVVVVREGERPLRLLAAD